MRNLIFILIFVSSTLNLVQGQWLPKGKRASWKQWYDSAAFFNGPEPLIKGFGDRSLDLSRQYSNKTIFEYQGKYYLINNLADYYFWFTRKYQFLFTKEASIYESYYYSGDVLNQAKFVKRYYKGKHLPVKFRFVVPKRSTSSHFPSVQDAPYNPDLNRAGPPTVQRFFKN